jgi:hypothetical protein
MLQDVDVITRFKRPPSNNRIKKKQATKEDVRHPQSVQTTLQRSRATFPPKNHLSFPFSF